MTELAHEIEELRRLPQLELVARYEALFGEGHTSCSARGCGDGSRGSSRSNVTADSQRPPHLGSKS